MWNRTLIALFVLSMLMAACAPAAQPEVVTVSVVDESGETMVITATPGGEYDYEEPAATEEEAEGDFLAGGDQAMPGPATEGQQSEPTPTAQTGPPQDMFFEDYGTQPFVDPAQDNLSTFAIDVDTGSYTLTRSYLNDGYLPPEEAVRLEEFVNYFEQDYPIPQDESFGIHLEAARTPFSAEDSYVVRVGIQGYEVPADQRPDATLIFVIDVSGSMNEDNRLGAVKRALHTLVNELRPTDKIGIVVYGSSGRVLLEPTEVGQAQEIRDIIDSLYPDGSTNAEEGLNLAYQMASANYDPNRINRLILCSDGVANVGATGPDPILETVRQQANEGITLTTVGFGMGNYNDVLMEQLADDGDGQYYYVDTTAEAERVFVSGLTGTLLTIGLDAKIQVEFNPEMVKAYRLMGYENRDVADSDFRNDDVDAGEIGAGHSVTALYEIIPTQNNQGIIGTVRMRWEDPESHEVTEIERSIDASEVQDNFEEASPRFRLDVAVAAFADVLGDGAWMQNADFDRILEVARGAAAQLPNDVDVQEFVALIEQAMGLSR
jgi:Ca-activated chloride channel homolog